MDEELNAAVLEPLVLPQAPVQPSMHEKMEESSTADNYELDLSGEVVLNCAIATPLITSTTTFIMFFSIHQGKLYDIGGVRQTPTLSLTGGYDPESIIFTYGMHLSAIFAAVLFVCIYMEMKNINKQLVLPHRDRYFEQTRSHWLYSWVLATSRQSVNRWLRVCLILSLMTSMLLSLVGSVSVAIHDAIHSVLATFMFLFGIVMMVCFHLLVCRPLCKNASEFVNNTAIVSSQQQQQPQPPAVRGLREREARMLWVQLLALFVCVPLNALIIIAAWIVNRTCDSMTCTRFYVHSSPCLEYTVVLSFLLFMESFRGYMKGVKISCVRFIVVGK